MSTSRPDNITIYEVDDDMHLSCSFVDFEDHDETKKIYTQLTGTSQPDKWAVLHDKILAKLVNEGTLIEFKEANNPPGVYGRAMVLNILPACLLDRGIIDQTTYHFVTQFISNAKIVKNRINALTSSQKDTLSERARIMDSFKGKK